ncbi:hypothetical protein B0T14DRAFT_501109 [Immersiella caudata]|uniref:Uncharacterized protein n=1 Tax=Immersiella caudata TaxID=314043 RepID=A0AA39WAL8_9PEZI|nr:hypothetical protein B0T14DRAFT_501109 [Immersiella caudata]
MQLLSVLAVVLPAPAPTPVSAAPVDEKRSYCVNSPTSRHCWGNYNIDTDVACTWPNLAVARSQRVPHADRLEYLRGLGPMLRRHFGQHALKEVSEVWGQGSQL